jgi:hypothetical protein
LGCISCLVEHRYALRSKGKPILEDLDLLRGNAKSGPSYECGLREELEPILGKENNEELVTKKSESGNVGSPVDEEKTEPMKEYDSVKGGDLGKTTDKKVKRQVLKYTSIDDDLYRRTINGVLLKCLGEEQAKVPVREVHDRICRAHQLAY